AMRSWLRRLKVRTQRPNNRSGIITRTTAPITSKVSLTLVTNIKIKPPTNMTKLRAATDAEEPTTVWINVVSALRRESTSPVRVTSKNVGDRRTTLANTALRRSAITRSPIQVTK